MGAAPRLTDLDVEVAGGTLHVARWGDGPEVVLAAHGITANSRSFGAVVTALAERRDDVTLVAPDLRGRGRSGSLPGPYGITAHVDDCVRVLDAVGATGAVVTVGHSMGGWVAALLAVRHPDRVSEVVLVDGGVALALPPPLADASVDDVLAAVIGPAMARLEMTWPTREAHLDFWRAHPALQGEAFSPVVEAYVDHDLVGAEPELRSSVSAEAVRGDATEQLTVPEVRDVALAVKQPVRLLLAPRGLLDGPPLYDPAALGDLGIDRVVVDDVNHYTIATSPRGAAAVAAAIDAAIG